MFYDNKSYDRSVSCDNPVLQQYVLQPDVSDDKITFYNNYVARQVSFGTKLRGKEDSVIICPITLVS
jgi:hypothetical protein